MIPKLVVRAACSGAIALALSNAAFASSPYDAIYAFGDSLSDAGNNFVKSGGVAPAAPYYNGQYSNGNVWLQTLATDLGVAAPSPSQGGGTDYAYGGAASGTTLFHAATTSDVTGSGGQVAQFLTSHPAADPNALYTLWIGTNDLVGIPDGSTSGQISQLFGQTVGNIDSAIGSLAAAGAKNFLLLTLPDLGKFPGVTNPAAVSAGTATFNSLLLQSLAQAPAGTHISVFDTSALYDQLVANPANYGLTDVTDICWNAATHIECQNPNQYLFWDLFGHPTAPVHVLIGNGAAAALPAVPVPAAAWLFGSGLGLLGLRRRRA